MLPAGKISSINYQANQLVLTYQNKNGKIMRLIIQVSNDAVAFRCQLPETSGDYAVINEHTGFTFPATSQFWTQDFIYNYEGLYPKRTYQDLIGKQISQPFLVKTPTHWLLIREAVLYGMQYSGVLFQGVTNSNRTLTTKFVPDQTSPVTGKLPLYTPWRVIVIGKTLAPIIESTI